RLLNESFGDNEYSMASLFRDERRKILSLILDETLADTAAMYRGVYVAHAQLIRYLIEMSTPVPKAFQAAAEIALNSELRKALKSSEIDENTVASLLKEASAVRVQLDVPTLEYAIRKRLEKDAEAFVSAPTKIEGAEKLKRLLDISESLPFPVDLWEI